MAKQKNTITIPVTIPAGISLDADAVKRANVAAQASIDASVASSAMSALLTSLERKGFNVTPAQWAALQGGYDGRPLRARITLTDEKRDEVVARIKQGATGSTICREFGISLATVNNIKKANGLSKARKAKRGKRA